MRFDVLRAVTMRSTIFWDMTPCSLLATYLLGFFFLVSWGGVRLNPLGTSATILPIVPAPDGR
jgi:hypothetical protein